jgi:hypothetical protein
VLILVPRQAIELAREAAPRPGEKVDTAPFLAAAAAAARTLAGADSALAQKRAPPRARRWWRRSRCVRRPGR